MKKLCFCCVILMLILPLLLFACNAPDDIVAQYLSYIENDCLLGEIEGYSVAVICGKTENPKTNDGKVSGEISPFLYLEVIPTVLGSLDKEVSYIIDGTQGVLSKSPKLYALTATLTTDYIPTSIKLVVDNEEIEVALTSINAEFLTSLDALDLAYSEFKSIFDEEITDDQPFCREIVVKIIPDSIGGKPFYYYVSFIKTADDYVSALIDPTERAVVARKS